MKNINLSIALAITIAILVVINTALAEPLASQRIAMALERLAAAQERLADCSCMQVCNQRRCLGSSSSDNGGPLP